LNRNLLQTPTSQPIVEAIHAHLWVEAERAAKLAKRLLVAISLLPRPVCELLEPFGSLTSFRDGVRERTALIAQRRVDVTREPTRLSRRTRPLL
jgi:hypothetical protein